MLQHMWFDRICEYNPDSKVHGAIVAPTWVLSAPDGPHVGPMNLVIREGLYTLQIFAFKQDDENLSPEWKTGIGLMRLGPILIHLV